MQTAGSVSDGRGEHRLYSKESLVQLAVVEILMGLNLPLAKVKEVMERFFKGPPFPNELTIAWVKAGRGLVMEVIEDPLMPIESMEVLLTLRVENIRKRVNRLVENQ